MKSLLQALRGESTGRPPIWLMRQAGRYLPEYRTLRAKANNFIEFCLTPDLAIEVTLQPVRRFGMDAAILFADILLIPYALGQTVAFVEGEGPRLEPVRTTKELDRLTNSHCSAMLAPVMQTIGGVRAALPADVTLIGFAGAPWTVATYMIEGSGGTDFEHCRRMLWSDPKLFAKIIDLLIDVTASYLIAQVDAGAETLQLFDSWAGATPASMFDIAVIEPTARVVQAVKMVHPGVPIIGFPRGAGSHLARYARETRVDAVGVDHMTDLSAARAAVPEGTTVQGNLDPVLLLTGGAPLERETRRLLGAMEGYPFIFNLGHGVLQSTPPEHVAQLVSLIRAGP